MKTLNLMTLPLGNPFLVSKNDYYFSFFLPFFLAAASSNALNVALAKPISA